MSGSTLLLVLVNHSRLPAQIISLGLGLSAFALTQAAMTISLGISTSADAFATTLVQIVKLMQMHLPNNSDMSRMLIEYGTGTLVPAVVEPRLSSVLLTRTRLIIIIRQ